MMTLRERNQWILHDDMQKNTNEKQDWYLAQIAYELYLIKFMFGGTPKHKMSDFLLKFQQSQQVDPANMTAAEKRQLVNERAKKSKMFWEAMVGKKASPSKKKAPKKEKVQSQNSEPKRNANHHKRHRSPRQR